MVKRVQEAHKKYPTFESLPIGGKKSDKNSETFTWKINETGGDAVYVTALYEVCFRGGVPIGRVDSKDGEAREIIAEVVTESAQSDYYGTGGAVMSADGNKEG